jgi:SAM-dependent methyltransferase
MIFVGDGSFRKTGKTFLKYFVELGELKPNESILDVGCGIGRMAIPLTKYLAKEGHYDGFDVVESGIDWCQKKVTPRYPNFIFKRVDIYNKRYNPQGKLKALEFKFPYGSASYDFTFLTSVFTHMLPDDMENYFSEIVRILKKGGRCLISFFLLNEESVRLIHQRKSTLGFYHEFNRYRTTDMNNHEVAVAYDEPYILELFKKHGLNIRHPIYYGSWCRRSSFLSYQDIIVASKN